jgi:hypothetical protein
MSKAKSKIKMTSQNEKMHRQAPALCRRAAVLDGTDLKGRTTIEWNAVGGIARLSIRFARNDTGEAGHNDK